MSQLQTQGNDGVGKFSTGDRILLISLPSFMWYIGPPLAGADVSRPPVLLAMPTFASSNPRLSTGLDMLAAAAAASEQPNTQPAGDGQGSSSNALEAFNQAGPFNPVASLPTKLVKQILNLEFVDMSEVTVDVDTPQAVGRPHPARLPVTSILQWLERFAMMAAIMVTRFPLKAPELFAYQALIVSVWSSTIQVPAHLQTIYPTASYTGYPHPCLPAEHIH